MLIVLFMLHRVVRVIAFVVLGCKQAAPDAALLSTAVVSPAPSYSDDAAAVVATSLLLGHLEDQAMHLLQHLSLRMFSQALFPPGNNLIVKQRTIQSCGTV